MSESINRDTYETEGAYFHIFMLPVARTGDTWAASGIWIHHFLRRIVAHYLCVMVGSYVDLMYKMMAAGPVPPFGGSEQYDISPTGDEVSFFALTTDCSSTHKVISISIRNNNRYHLHVKQ
jgi:hypothetical protein